MVLKFVAGVFLLSVTLGGSLKNKWKSFCDLEVKAKDGEIKCCKAKENYRVHIGVCEDDAGLKLFGKLGHQVIGYNSSPLKNVTPDEANSDHDSNENNPGHDEGVCHVYKAYMGKNKERKVCVPGNMLLAAELIQQWQDTAGTGHQCSFNLGSDCKGIPNAKSPYDFAIKLNVNDENVDLTELRTSLRKQTELSNDYRCQVTNQSGDYYVVCPL